MFQVLYRVRTSDCPREGTEGFLAAVRLLLKSFIACIFSRSVMLITQSHDVIYHKSHLTWSTRIKILDSSLSMRQNSRSAGHRRKYDTTRAFFITVLAISVLVVWTLITGPDNRSHKLIKRELHIVNEGEISKPVNLDVSIPDSLPVANC